MKYDMLLESITSTQIIQQTGKNSNLTFSL